MPLTNTHIWFELLASLSRLFHLALAATFCFVLFLKGITNCFVGMLATCNIRPPLAWQWVCVSEAFLLLWCCLWWVFLIPRLPFNFFLHRSFLQRSHCLEPDLFLYAHPVRCCYRCSFVNIFLLHDTHCVFKLSFWSWAKL